MVKLTFYVSTAVKWRTHVSTDQAVDDFLGYKAVGYEYQHREEGK